MPDATPDAVPLPVHGVADTSEPDGTEPSLTTRQLFFRVFPSIVLAMFLAAIDNTIVATALPNIAASLGDVERVSWVVVSYLMSTTVAAAVYGRLGDAMGRKRLLLVSLAVFIVASLLCAAAPTMLLLVAARGAAGHRRRRPDDPVAGPGRRGRPPARAWQDPGLHGRTFMIASTFGPVARRLADPELRLALRLHRQPARRPRRALHGVPPQDQRHPDRAHPLRLAGPVAVRRLRRPRCCSRWSRPSASPGSAAPAIAGWTALALSCLWLLLRQERRAASPLIPVKLLRHGAIWRADAMGACVGATIIGAVTFMPIYLQAVRGADPTEVGWLMLPLTAGIAIGAMITGRLVSITRPHRDLPVLRPGGGDGVPGRPGVRHRLAAHVAPALAVPGAVHGHRHHHAGRERHRAGGGRPQEPRGRPPASVQFTRSIGGALGTATIGAVLFGVLAWATLASRAPSPRSWNAAPEVLTHMQADVRASLGTEISGAFRAAFLCIACFSAAAMVLAWSLPVRRI